MIETCQSCVIKCIKGALSFLIMQAKIFALIFMHYKKNYAL